MELAEKVKSTKLGIAAASIATLYQLDANPWTIVAVTGIYMICNAIQTIGSKDIENRKILHANNIAK